MNQIVDQDQHYTYEIFHEEDSIECARFLAQSFTRANPYQIFLKTSYEQFYRDALLLCQSIAHLKLPIIARHKHKNEIEAMVQVVDAKTFDQDENQSGHVGSDSEAYVDPIVGLLHELDEAYVKDYEEKFGDLSVKQVAHILMAGVSLSSIGRGLGTKIHQVFLEHARKSGFKHVFVDATSPIISHIYTKKLNGNVFSSIYAPTWTSKNSMGSDYQPLKDFQSDVSLIVFDLQI